MKKTISQLFIVVLSIFLILEPVALAQNYSESYRFAKPLQENDSGLSFRKTNPMVGGEDVKWSSSIREQVPVSMFSQLVYQIHILGEVKAPGTYRIAASDRLSEVLTRAGGIKENGSKRNIELRRQGKVKQIVDLLPFQLFGELRENPFLLDNDVIYVPLKNKSIRVVGAVKRPDEYELKSEKTLGDVVFLAGDTTVGASSKLPFKVIRFVDGKKEVLEVEQKKELFSDFEMKNGDIVFVPHIITEKNTFDFDIPKLPGDNIFYPSYEDRVFILGGVSLPGAYPFNPYYKLSQYLSLAGGTTKLATKKIYLINPEGDKKRLRRKNWDKIVINPGDTVLVDERRIPPEGWVSLFMSVAGFGLSATATVLTLTQ